MSVRRALQILFGIVLVVAPPLVRWLMFSDGEIYGPASSRYVNAFIAALAVLGCLIIYKAYTKADTKAYAAANSPPQGAVVLLAGLAGAATAVFSLTQFFFPETPLNAAAPACINAPVEGAAFLAQTADQGVVSRTGAGRHFAQAGRFPAACTVGFDGFCIGESFLDPVLGTPDRRWLIVHNRQELVPAAFVLSQDSEQRFGGPDPSCDKYGGLGSSVIEGVTISPALAGTTALPLSAKAANPAYVGYAATTVEANSRRFVQLARSADASSGFASSWDIMSTNPFPSGTSGHTWVAAASCLAGNAPDAARTTRVLRVHFENGQISNTPEVTKDLPRDVQSQLAQMACARTAPSPSQD